MKLTCVSIFCLGAALALTGCGRKQVTETQRKQAAQYASEADFAMNLRDWARAESTLEKAVAIAPDTGPYWVSLGMVRIRLGKRDAARTAYKNALGAFEADAKGAKSAVDPWLQQIYVLALMGKADEARARLDKAAQKFPDNRDLRAFIDRKQLDQMLADPGFKEVSL